MTNARTSRLKRENATLRAQIATLGDLANGGPNGAEEDFTPSERVQAEAVEAVAAMTGYLWISHERFRAIAVALLDESQGALDVLDAGGDLDEYRERAL